MLLSVASARPRNIESSRVNDLIPPAIATNAKNLIDLLEHYYKYLNEEGMPSAEIGSISSLKDIDQVSERYLSQIEELIGKNVPFSTAINRIELYKIIVKYYNTRGSEDSIHTFFKIFFDQVVEVIYPKEFLFDLSGSSGSGDHHSYLSDQYRLFDGYYWQDYSYVIKSDLDISVWYDEYLKFVHPAGLKLFSSMIVEIFARNEWYESMSYVTSDIDTDNAWMQSLIPSHNKNHNLFGFHTPRYQPGWLRDKFIKFLLTYISTDSTWRETNLLRLLLVSLQFTTSSHKIRNEYVRERYLVSEKFIDSLEIGAGLLNKTIAEADAVYAFNNSCRHLNLSAYITPVNPYDFSYFEDSTPSDVANEDGLPYVDEFGNPYFTPNGLSPGAGEGDWSASGHDDSEGAGSGGWFGSYLDPI